MIDFLNYAPPKSRFVQKEDAIWERIKYLKSVLDTPGIYRDVPNRNDILRELRDMLQLYTDYIGKELA